MINLTLTDLLKLSQISVGHSLGPLRCSESTFLNRGSDRSQGWQTESTGLTKKGWDLVGWYQLFQKKLSVYKWGLKNFTVKSLNNDQT